MKRLIILTTPTSGTLSLWRIVTRFLPENTNQGWFVDECLNQGISLEAIRKQSLPEEGCYLFNQPHLFNFDQDFSETQFILNFRDPRDMACNKFYWVFNHPSALSEEEQVKEQERIRTQGIDDYALSVDDRFLFASHIKILETPALLEKTLSVSYVQLCFDTDGVVERLANFFDVSDDGLINSSKLFEHPSSLMNSDQWIGGQWTGADVFPGRARVELKSSTFTALTDRYRKVLRCLRKLDDPKYRFFYGP